MKLKIGLVFSCLIVLAACNNSDKPVEQVKQNDSTETTVASTETNDESKEKTDKPSKLVDQERINTALKSLVDDQSLVGVSALVFEKGEEVYFGAFGMADKEKQQPMKRDTIIQIYSMTKPITGVTLMTLYEEGKFKLEDPLVKYAPEFANLQVFAGLDDAGEAQYEKPNRAITIRDIMRHTAGWNSGDEQAAVTKIWREQDPTNRKNTLTEMVEKMAKVPLLFQPGTRWLYGPSVDVQAFLAERLSGKPYIELVQERVLTPLKMVDTGYYLPEEKRSRLSAIYTRKEDGTMEAMGEDAYEPYTKHWALTPGGWGLVSTLDDYMRFARMLQNEGELNGIRILKPETIALMATDAMPDTVTDKSWLPSKGQVGFGIDFAVRIAPPANAEEASGAVGEFFWDGAANTLFWVDPKNDITAVLFNHYRPFGNVPIHKNFRDAIYFSDPEAYAK